MMPEKPVSLLPSLPSKLYTLSETMPEVVFELALLITDTL